MSSERIEALEIALAHAEAAVEDLSDVVQKQNGDIAALRRDVGKLTRTIEAMLEKGEEAAPADAKPPHY